jgi:hypothetical protein
MDAIFTDSVTNAADPIQALGTIVHVEQAIMVDNSGIKNIITFPI